MTTHSCVLAWKVPYTEETGRLQPMGSQRVGDMTERFHFHFHFLLVSKKNKVEEQSLTGCNILQRNKKYFPFVPGCDNHY